MDTFGESLTESFMGQRYVFRGNPSEQTYIDGTNLLEELNKRLEERPSEDLQDVAMRLKERLASIDIEAISKSRHEYMERNRERGMRDFLMHGGLSNHAQPEPIIREASRALGYDGSLQDYQYNPFRPSANFFTHKAPSFSAPFGSRFS